MTKEEFLDFIDDICDARIEHFEAVKSGNVSDMNGAYHNYEDMVNNFWEALND